MKLVNKILIILLYYIEEITF